MADSNSVEEGGAGKLQGWQSDQYNREMLAHQRIALIGAGNMAEAILAGLLQNGQLAPAQFIASDISQARRSDLMRTMPSRRQAVIVR